MTVGVQPLKGGWLSKERRVLNDMRRQLSLVFALTALAVVGLFGGAAFAQVPAGTVTAVNDSISGGASTATGLITSNIPVLLSVTGVWIALAFGRKLLKKVMGS